MSHIGFAKNEYDQTISLHVCESCERPFNVIPPIKPETEGWEGCMELGCDSYDVERDVDLMFAVEPERVKMKDVHDGQR